MGKNHHDSNALGQDSKDEFYNTLNNNAPQSEKHITNQRTAEMKIQDQCYKQFDSCTEKLVDSSATSNSN